MTRDKDQLISAYIDGETTAEETAWVESDTETMHKVEAYRKVQTLIKTFEAADVSKKEDHISAALTSFKATLDTPEPEAQRTDDTVIPIHRDGRQKDEAAVSGNPALPSKNRHRWFTPIASAAAVVIVASAGYSFFTSESSDSSTSIVAADKATSETNLGVDESDEAAMPESEAEESDDSASSANESAMQDDLADESGRPDSSDGSHTPANGAAPEESPRKMSPLGGPPNEFDAVPSQAKLESLATSSKLSTQYTRSPCSQSVEDPDGGDQIGFIPVKVDGVEGEILVFESDVNESGISLFLVTTECTPF